VITILYEGPMVDTARSWGAGLGKDKASRCTLAQHIKLVKNVSEGCVTDE
jgi:hypothetical protein